MKLICIILTMHFLVDAGDWSSRAWLEATDLLHCKLCPGSSEVNTDISFFGMTSNIIITELPEFSKLLTSNQRRLLARQPGLHWTAGRPLTKCFQPRVWLESAWFPNPLVGRHSQRQMTLSILPLSLKQIANNNRAFEYSNIFNDPHHLNHAICLKPEVVLKGQVL